MDRGPREKLRFPLKMRVSEGLLRAIFIAHQACRLDTDVASRRDIYNPGCALCDESAHGKYNLLYQGYPQATAESAV